MALATSTGTLAAGASRTFDVPPGSVVSLACSPNVIATVVETPNMVAGAQSMRGPSSPRTTRLSLAGTFVFGPYEMGAAVVVTMSALSGSSVTWTQSSSAPGVATDANGNVVGISVGGVSSVFTKSRQLFSQIDIYDMYQSSDRRSVTLPNPYSAVGPDLVHPSVVHCPAGLFGWRYWMAYTPYPLSSSIYENPCIAVSQDGEIWEAPSGVINPIVSVPSGGYNADPHLTLNETDGKLYLIYRARIAGVANRLMVMESSNGISWSEPVAVLSGVYGTEDYGSPSVWLDPSDNRWTMIYHNLDGGVTYPMYKARTSGSSIYSDWSAGSLITIANPTGGRTWWHSQFMRLPDGRVVGIVMDIVNGGSGAAGALFAAESLDGGLTFTVRIIYSDLGFYRTSFNIVENDEKGPSLNVWIGRQDTVGFSIRREDWSTGATSEKFLRNATYISLYGGYPSNYLFWDNFNRADGAVGSPLVGSAPTVDTGTFTISTNRLSTGSAGNNRELATLSTSDYVAEVVYVSATATAAWLWFRTVNTTNFYRVGVGAGLGNTLYLEKFVGGAQSFLNQVTGPVYQSIVSPGDRIRVVCRGRRFRIYVNDIFWQEVEDTSFYVTGVKVGVQGTNAGVIFDNLLVTA